MDAPKAPWRMNSPARFVGITSAGRCQQADCRPDRHQAIKASHDTVPWHQVWHGVLLYGTGCVLFMALLYAEYDCSICSSSVASCCTVRTRAAGLVCLRPGGPATFDSNPCSLAHLVDPSRNSYACCKHTLAH